MKIFDDLSKDFNKHRTYFYSAESLKRCIRDIFTNDDEFINLKKEVLSGVIDFTENTNFCDSLDRLKKTMHEVTKVNFSFSIIDRELNFVCNDDKKGIGHHLANEDLLYWRGVK